MNLTQCSNKINDSTGNYLNFNSTIGDDHRDIYSAIKQHHHHHTHHSGKKDRISKKKSRSSYMCRKCRAHGQLLPVKNHRRNCPFKMCPCPLCTVVSHGRDIVARQIRLYRNQKDSNKPVPQSPHCRRCRNHGEHNAWKGHKKKCRHSNCPCKLCLLITMRKSNEKSYREIIQESGDEKVATPKTNGGTVGGSGTSFMPPSASAKDGPHHMMMEDQSLLIRNITRAPLLSPPSYSTLYDNIPHTSIYAQNPVLNFPVMTGSENCVSSLKPSLNWTSPYKLGGVNPWETVANNGSGVSSAFDMQTSSYCNSTNNPIFNGTPNINQSSMEYLPPTAGNWYSNFY